jgi:signal transduction histidine kinase/CheY-like chemotaxis protein
VAQAPDNDASADRPADHVIQALRRANAMLEAKLAAAQADCARCQTARTGAQRLETLGHLAGGMAHDFSNVLQAVLAVASLLKRHANDPERVMRHVAMLERAAARGAAVTDRLLAYGRTRDIATDLVDPKVLLSHLCDSLQPTMPEMTIAVDVGSGVPHLKTDPDQLEMTLINLANNARDSMIGAPGRMTLSAHWMLTVPLRADLTSDGGFVCLAVRDTGIGMDSQTLVQAAEPFFTTKPQGKGTGLGLALASRFCREAGGILTIESAVGAGTTIRMYLPTSAGSTPGDPEPLRFAIPGPVAILRQTEPVVRDGLRAGLLARGFRVLDAAALETEDDPAPDLLVVDLSADQPAGAEVLRLWRGRLPGLPVVALIDRAQTVPEVSVTLVKPVSPADLAEAAVRLMAAAAPRPNARA